MLKKIALFFTCAAVALAQTTTMVDWLTQIKNKPDFINPTFSSLISNGIYVPPTNAGSSGVGGYVHIPPVLYPDLSCRDIFGNVVNQPAQVPGLPPFGVNDAVMWVSTSPLSGATPGGCLPSPFSQQQDFGLNINTYVFSLVGFATDRPAFNSFESLSGGYHGLTFDADDYMYTGAYGGAVAAGPPDPWGRTGTVNTAGTAVHLASGLVFFSGIIGPVFGGFITIANVQYSVASVTDPENLVLTTSAGTQTGAPYIIHGWGAGAMSFSYTGNCEAQYSAGTWACQSGGGTPGSPVNSVQFNNGGIFAGNAAFTFNSGSGVIQVCATLGGICTATSGVQAQAFSSSATGTAVSFTNIGATFTILGNGQGNFNTLNAGAGSPFTVSVAGLVGGATFGSSATGGTHAFTTNSGNAFINGDGSGNFNTLNIGPGPAFTVSAAGNISGGTGSFKGTGSTTAGEISILDTGNAGGISIFSSLVTRQATWLGTSSASLEVVGSANTNDLVVFNGGTIRVPHLTASGSGGSAVCVDSGFNFYKGPC